MSTTGGATMTGTTRSMAPTINAVGGWKWSSRQSFWYLPSTWRYSTTIHRARCTVAALQAAGISVELVEERDERSYAERHADRDAQLDARHDRLLAGAGKAADAVDAAYGRYRQIADMIPLGQPVLVGHHSERRHRRDIGRMDSAIGQSVRESRRAEELARRAAASARLAALKETAPATLRRIGRLEEDLRRLCRALPPCPLSGKQMKPEAAGREVTCPKCYAQVTIGLELRVPRHRGATGQRRHTVLVEIRNLADEIAGARDHVAQLEAEGVKVWRPADFAKGDLVHCWRGWVEVARVNPKSVTVKYRPRYGDRVLTATVPYDQIKERMSAAEVADMRKPEPCDEVLVDER